MHPNWLLPLKTVHLNMIYIFTERVLLTGLHAVADIMCECCKTTLGWKYVRTTKGINDLRFSITLIWSLQEHAYESSQKYKEGKYIIELVHMIKVASVQSFANLKLKQIVRTMAGIRMLTQKESASSEIAFAESVVTETARNSSSVWSC